MILQMRSFLFGLFRMLLLSPKNHQAFKAFPETAPSPVERAGVRLILHAKRSINLLILIKLP